MLTLGRIKVVVVALMAAGAVWSCGPRAGRGSRGGFDGVQSISLSDTLRVDTIDFGVVSAGEIVERAICLSNESSAPLIVVTTDTSCGCLELDYVREPIEGGGRASATMRFFSSGYNYFPPRAFYIVTSASMAPKKLVVTATME